MNSAGRSRGRARCGTATARAPPSAEQTSGDTDKLSSVEFPGFSGQTLASGFSRRSYAEVQAPDPWESAIGLRIHQGASRSVQRADDVSRSRGCPERLLRLALAAP